MATGDVLDRHVALAIGTHTLATPQGMTLAAGYWVWTLPLTHPTHLTHPPAPPMTIWIERQTGYLLRAEGAGQVISFEPNVPLAIRPPDQDK